MNSDFITKNFQEHEFLFSETAIKHGIANVYLKEEHKQNLFRLVKEFLQKVRDLTEHAIKVTSGYRVPELNNHPDIGGAPNSDHTEGKACDFYSPFFRTETLFYFIINNVKLGKLPIFTKLILYKGKKNLIHLSYDPALPAEQQGWYWINENGKESKKQQITLLTKEMQEKAYNDFITNSEINNFLEFLAENKKYTDLTLQRIQKIADKRKLPKIISKS